MNVAKPPMVHSTAEIHKDAKIGDGSSVWNWVQIREGVTIGADCIISKGVYVDANVEIGRACKVQNNVSLFHGVRLEDGVFVGPHVCFTNDLLPRAVEPDGTPKGAGDWVVSQTRVCTGAAIGANSTIRCGVTVGEWSMIAAGSVVTRNVPPYTLVQGNPARPQGSVCRCGKFHRGQPNLPEICPACGQKKYEGK